VAGRTGRGGHPDEHALRGRRTRPPSETPLVQYCPEFEPRFVGRRRVLSVEPSEVQHGKLYHGANEPQAVVLPLRRGGRCSGHVRARHALPVGWVARQEARKTETKHEW
jgi:hypothetical protein